MNFGFVTAALKSLGLEALTVAETVGPAAATAFGGPLAGQLAMLAVQAISAAQARHGASPPPVQVATTTGTASVDPRKLDVMQSLEQQAGTIANMVLAATGRAVSDPARFATGVNALVEGLVDIMKAVDALPINGNQTVPSKSTPAPSPVAAPTAPVVAPVVVTSTVPAFVGVVSNNDAPTPVSADVIALLNQVLTRLGSKVTVTA